MRWMQSRMTDGTRHRAEDGLGNAKRHWSCGGRGGYRGAHWHTVREARRLFRDVPVRHVSVQTAIPIPSGGWFARLIERAWPLSLPGGAFILVTGDVHDSSHHCFRSIATGLGWRSFLRNLPSIRFSASCAGMAQ